MVLEGNSSQSRDHRLCYESIKDDVQTWSNTYQCVKALITAQRARDCTLYCYTSLSKYWQLPLYGRLRFRSGGELNEMRRLNTCFADMTVLL